MNSTLSRRIVIIAFIIVLFWAIGMLIKLAGWFLNLLLPVAALILIVALIISWRSQRTRTSSQNTKSTKEPLRITRDTSNKK